MKSDNNSFKENTEPLEGPRDYTLAEETYDYDTADYTSIQAAPPLPPGRFAAWVILGVTTAILITTIFSFRNSPALVRYALIAILFGAVLYLLFSRRNNEVDDDDGAVI